MSETDDYLPRGITEENRPEWMTDEYLEHQEWWIEESQWVRDLIDELLADILENERVRVGKRGVEVTQSGTHRASFTLYVDGEPFADFVEEAALRNDE